MTTTAPSCSHPRTVATNLGRLCRACNVLVPAGQSRYRHERVEADGFTFDSKAEYGRYCELVRAQQAGEIGGLVVHPKYGLMVAGVLVRSYTADFSYRDAAGRLITEDVKSNATRKARDWAMTRKLFRACVGRELVEVIR